MRILALNHTPTSEYDAAGEQRIVDLLQSYASAGTTVEFGCPEDLGGGVVLHHIRKGKALAGLHHILETPALVKKVIEAERDGFDAVMQTNTFDPGVEACRLAVRIPVVGVMRASLHFAACLVRPVRDYGAAGELCAIRGADARDLPHGALCHSHSRG